MIHYIIKILIYVLWWSSVANGARQLVNYSQNVTNLHPIGQDQIIVELAIVCDFDFATQFQNDDQSLLNYWSAVMRDVHLRFISLQNCSVSFRVTTIFILESRDDQYFVEHLRETNGKLPANNVTLSFEQWIYLQTRDNNFTSYDIAVLAVGTPFLNHIKGMAPRGTVCLRSSMGQYEFSVLTITSVTREMGRTLAHEIGHLLGAEHDMKEDNPISECGPFDELTSHYIMSNSNFHDLLGHVFSPCSQILIGKVLQNYTSNCLRGISTAVIPLIDTAMQCSDAHNFAKMAVMKQCQLLLNNTHAYVEMEDDNCNGVRCHFNTTTLKAKKTFVFGETPCRTQEYKGICFWGTCVQEGIYLVNLATEQVLGNGNFFGLNESPVLLTNRVEKYFNPLELLRINPIGSDVVQITALYYNSNGFRLDNKCLGLNKSESLIFVECRSSLSRNITTLAIWVIEQSPDNKRQNVFLVRHVFTKKCVSVIWQHSLALPTMLDCSWEDNKQLWKYLSKPRTAATNYSNCSNGNIDFQNYNLTHVTFDGKTEVASDNHYYYLSIMGALILITLTVAVCFCTCLRMTEIRQMATQYNHMAF